MPPSGTASTNPSHILIARNSRGSSNPSASLSCPTETHAAAAGIFRSSGSPTWHLEECETDEVASNLSTDDEDGSAAIEIDEAFTKHSRFPGTVKIIVESTTFWAHREVLFFASPFFEAALTGGWAETGRRQSVSSVITISQPPTIPGDHHGNEGPTEMTFTHLEPDADAAESPSERVDKSKTAQESDSEDDTTQLKDENKAKSRNETSVPHENVNRPTKHTVQHMKGRSYDIENSDLTEGSKSTKMPLTLQGKVRNRPRSRGPDAVILLREERASTFHDFLKFVYPHVECTITWNNVEGLMNISHKLCVPSLQQECLAFLLTHAAGRPIKAMRIAELFEEEELYRESSRFVLDNPGGWSEQELSTLSQDTLLKLEKRRNWFLERVLKLGLTSIAKEYQCCATCPEPSTCARLLDEKWRQAYHAVFRFGPCQPSMVYRYLRTLEGISPPLALTHLSCQATAKAFIATLFDRMFSLGIRGSGADTAPLGARVAGVAGGAAGPRRHFMYCSLKSDPPRNKRSKETVL